MFTFFSSWKLLANDEFTFGIVFRLYCGETFRRALNFDLD